MTKQSFWKSTSFKCIWVLLLIVLTSGILLTFCNALFYVSDAERLDRAVKKIYGKSVETVEVVVDDDYQNEIANIQLIYQVTEDGNYLVKSQGLNGFSGGSVTCWVVVQNDGTNITGIGNVIIDNNVGQSYIAKIKDKFLKMFGADYEDGIEYKTDDGYFSSGATNSSRSIDNAVNGAIDYVKTVILGGVA